MFTITRQDEANFPDFKSLAEARAYFRNRYGDKYREGDWERIDVDRICYFDKVDYQPVQISVFDDGSVLVHVVY